MERGAVIVAGLGFRAAATADSLRDALARCGAHPLAGLAVPADKAQADCLIELAQSLLLPILLVTPEGLQRVETLTKAPRIQALRGTGSVAEAAALAAAGPVARLLGPRVVSADRQATAALAQSGPDP